MQSHPPPSQDKQRHQNLLDQILWESSVLQQKLSMVIAVTRAGISLWIRRQLATGHGQRKGNANRRKYAGWMHVRQVCWLWAI